ncbi:hypothetical protein C8J56DRAFT_791765, partial [Mycena floridula]
CWGFAKRLYWMCPVSSKEANLERNMVESLNAVPIISMHRFATRSNCFADRYFHGLNGTEAAWANKKFRGHRCLPPGWKDHLPGLKK